MLRMQSIGAFIEHHHEAPNSILRCFAIQKAREGFSIIVGNDVRIGNFNAECFA